MIPDKFNELIDEFKQQRDALKVMITDLEGLKKRVDQLFPATLDMRYARQFEEKIKTTTELFKALLNMRQEIMKSIKDEIEIRRRYDESDVDAEEVFSIRDLAKQIETINKTKNNIEESITRELEMIEQ